MPPLPPHRANRTAALMAALARTYGQDAPPRRITHRTRIRLRADLGWTTIRAYLAYGWIFDLRGTTR